MGIFFDHDWFDDRLKAAGLTRASMAMAAGMTADEVELVFADRRELDPPEVHAIARALSVDPREVAMRSGVAEPIGLAALPGVPRHAEAGGQAGGIPREVIAGLHERMDRLERMLEMVLEKLDRRS